MITTQVIKFTTDGAGAVTTNGESSVLGKLFAIEYQPGTIATGATLTVTCENGVFSKPLLTKANAGTSACLFYPRDIIQGVEDGAALLATSGGDRVQPLLSGRPRVVIASGGATASGLVILYFEE